MDAEMKIVLIQTNIITVCGNRLIAYVKKFGHNNDLKPTQSQQEVVKYYEVRNGNAQLKPF